MPIYQVSANGGTLRASNSNDTITGSAFTDKIFGLGGSDVINAGDGDDYIESDGAYTVADAIRETGSATIPYTATSNTANPGLTSMGQLNGLSVWRIRNTTDVAQVVVFQSASNGNASYGPITLTIPPHSDSFVTSSNTSTHKLFVGTRLVDTKAAGTGVFANSTPLPSVDGNDTVHGGNGNDTIIGGGGNDTLFGDAGKDSLSGGDGDDTLIGGADGDILSGGAGIDTADYSASSAGVSIDLQQNIAHGGDAEGDTFNDIENLIGSNFNDVLVGNSSVNRIDGGDGEDIITGGSNNDNLYGGAGNDTFLVEWSNTGDNYFGGSGTDTFSADVAVLDGYAQEINLATGTNNWGDTFNSIENLIGGTKDDKFWGTDTENSFWGRGGNDLLDGKGGNDKLYGEAGNDTLIGGAGADAMDGGSDVDTASYASSLDGVNVNLVSGVGSGGDAAGDTLVNIENVIGSAFADVIAGNVIANNLAGGDGVDTLDYAASLAGVNINLATNVVSGGFAEGDVVVGFENVTGTDYADTLVGNAEANTLVGGKGDDVLNGAAGADVLSGGNGVDTIDGGDDADKISGGDGNDVLSGGAGTDIIDGGLDADRLSGGDGEDSISGGDGNDAIYGDAGNDVISGGLGNDRITGGAGADKIVGNEGVDTADYRHSALGVTVSLTSNTGVGGDAQGDTLASIENLSGSAFNDILTGDGGVNRITGMSGEDKIYGMGGNDFIATGGGYDYVDGGTGIDTVTYEDSWDRVVVNLATGVNQYGEASRDVLVNVENIMGSAFGDTITGDKNANRLNGMAGDDVISAGAGIDYLLGGGGNDKLTGGTEADVFVFDDVFGNDTITDFWKGAGRTDRIWLTDTGLSNFAEVTSHAVNSAAGVVITIADHGSITLTGVTLAQLHADDFIFG